MVFHVFVALSGVLKRVYEFTRACVMFFVWLKYNKLLHFHSVSIGHFICYKMQQDTV